MKFSQKDLLRFEEAAEEEELFWKSINEMDLNENDDEIKDEKDE